MLAKQLLVYINRGLRMFSRGILVIAVFFTVINAFVYFTHEDKSGLPTIEDKIAENSKKIENYFKDPAINTPEKKAVASLLQLSVCNTFGEACFNKKTADENFDGSYMGSFASTFAIPFENPPASGVYYTLNKLENAGLVPQAYAVEGIGFAGLKPLLEVWEAFRNLAFLVLVMILIAIGFMIMFRMKLDAQTVVGIESALPRIIVTLILITFSFAIAGFLIDLAYITMAIIIVALSNVVGGLSSTDLLGKYLQAGPDDLIGFVSGVRKTGGHPTLLNAPDILYHLPNAVLGIFGPRIRATFQFISGSAAAYFLGPKIFDAWSKTIGPIFRFGGEAEAGVVAAQGHFGNWDLFEGVANGVGLPVTYAVVFLLAFFFLPFLLGIVIFITVIFIAFRLLFALLFAYLKILLLVLLSPIILMFGAIPGRSVFGSWIKGLVAELMTFPLMMAIFLIGLIIFEVSASGTLIRFPFTHRIDAGAWSLIVGMTFLFMTPDILKSIKKQIAPQSILPEGGIGVLFAGGAALFGAGKGIALGAPSIVRSLPKSIRDSINRGGGPVGKWLTGAEDAKESAENLAEAITRANRGFGSAQDDDGR